MNIIISKILFKYGFEKNKHRQYSSEKYHLKGSGNITTFKEFAGAENFNLFEIMCKTNYIIPCKNI